MDRYFAPSGLGTSGSGLTRFNPIYGLNDLSSVQAGDNLILLPGNYYERFVVPQNDLQIISEGAVFDGAASLNGSFTVNSSFANVQASAWTQVSTNPNVWKKGCQYLPMLIVDGTWWEPMPSSVNTNSAATIISNIGLYEWTIRDESLDGQNRAIYLRLDQGDIPGMHNIRIATRRGPSGAYGIVEASEKSNLVFDGEFIVNNVFDAANPCFPFWIDRCEGVENSYKSFITQYCYYGIRITAGGDISLSGKGDHLYTSLFNLDCANESTGVQYAAAGDITVTNWESNYCGWMPRYNGRDAPSFSANDADGGVGIGYRGGTFKNVTVEKGVCKNGGASVTTIKPGWAGDDTSLRRGWGIICGTVNATVIDSLVVRNNIIDSQRYGSISLGGTSVLYNRKIACLNNVIKGNKAPTINVNQGTAVLAVTTFNASQTPIDIEICNNTIVGGSSSLATISCGFSAAGAQSGNIKVANNTIQGVSLESGYASSHGHLKLAYVCTGTKQFDGNNIDTPLGGVYGRDVSSSTANLTAWRLRGYGANDVEGTVTVNDDYSLTAGTANPIGTGVKYWGSSPRPTAFNGEPLPDIGVDIGAVQTTSHEFHPVNL
jgi:hypothetical protein